MTDTKQSLNPLAIVATRSNHVAGPSATPFNFAPPNPYSASSHSPFLVSQEAEDQLYQQVATKLMAVFDNRQLNTSEQPGSRSMPLEDNHEIFRLPLIASTTAQLLAAKESTNMPSPCV